MKPSRFACLAVALLALVWSDETWSAEPAPAAAKAEDRDEIVAAREKRLQQLEKNWGKLLPGGLRPVVGRKLTIEFVEQPVVDAFEFLGAAYRVQILLSRGEFRVRKLNSKIDLKPLRDVLDALATQLELDWDTDGYAIYVGEQSAVRTFRRLIETRDERRRKCPVAVAGRLQEPLDLECVDLPLEHTVEFIASAMQLSMRLDQDPKLPKLQISFATRPGGLPTDVVLDLLSIRYDLRWEVDDAGTVIIKRVVEET
ncbi:MAG: hypothetical protein KY476_00870 [Planctomycetes bacterium]|nr:hypothetical protein [Planctomycetota bacterium]